MIRETKQTDERKESKTPSRVREGNPGVSLYVPAERSVDRTGKDL